MVKITKKKCFFFLFLSIFLEWKQRGSKRGATKFQRPINPTTPNSYCMTTGWELTLRKPPHPFIPSLNLGRKLKKKGTILWPPFWSKWDMNRKNERTERAYKLFCVPLRSMSAKAGRYIKWRNIYSWVDAQSQDTWLFLSCVDIWTMNIIKQMLYSREDIKLWICILIVHQTE